MGFSVIFDNAECYNFYMSKYQEQLSISIEKQVQEKLKDMPNFSVKFFKNLENKGCSERTIIGYVYDLQTFFKYLEDNGFNNLKSCNASDCLDKLTIDDIQEYLDDFKYYDGPKGDTKYSINSKARRISSLRSFYRFYYRIGEIKNNLADLIDMPKIKDKKIKVLDTKQVERVLDTINDLDGLSKHQKAYKQATLKRDLAIITTFLGTGIRVSELVGLDVKDVDLHNASFVVVRKGGNEDTVYFGQVVEDALRDYIENERDNILNRVETDALFVSMQGKRMTVRSVEKLVKETAERAGLATNTTPHTLRRTFGTRLYEETNDIYLVATALHHSSVETTKKHYAKMDEERKRQAAKVNIFN